MSRDILPVLDVGLRWGRRIHIVIWQPRLGQSGRGQIKFEVLDRGGDRIGQPRYTWSCSSLYDREQAAAVSVFRAAWRNRLKKMKVRDTVEGLAFIANKAAAMTPPVLREKPAQTRVLNIDGPGFHWVEALRGQHCAVLETPVADDEWDCSVLAAAKAQVLAQEVCCAAAVKRCLGAVATSAPFAHLSSFPSFENSIDQVRMRKRARRT